MNCKKAEEHIYLYNELTTDERAVVDAHLHICIGCRTLFQEQQVVAETIKMRKVKHELRDPVALTQRIMAQVEEEKNKVVIGWFGVQQFLSTPALRYTLSGVSFILIMFFAIEQNETTDITQAATVLSTSLVQTEATLNTSAILQAVQSNRIAEEKSKSVSLFACLKTNTCTKLTQLKARKFYAQRY